MLLHVTEGLRRSAPVCSRLRRRDAGGAGLLASAGVLVHRALLHGLVDPGDERPVLGLYRRSVAILDGFLEPPEIGLHGAGQQAVLSPLALAAQYPLLL